MLYLVHAYIQIIDIDRFTHTHTYIYIYTHIHIYTYSFTSVTMRRIADVWYFSIFHFNIQRMLVCGAEVVKGLVVHTANSRLSFASLG